MDIKKYDGFVDKIHKENDGNLNEPMKIEIKTLLIEFAQAYDLEEDPDEQVNNCSESIMNLILEVKYEW